jgi:peptidoglycan/LPS O-acetylase OafA/YrhL
VLLLEYARGRDNNLNLIRFLAASAVLVSHSYPIAGAAGAEPLVKFIGISGGAVAVDIFFATSGFLVTRSLLTSGHTLDFVVARILRIYPALLAVIALTVVGLGVAATSLSWQAYLRHAQTKDYLMNAAAIFNTRFFLPGVFDGNPYPSSVNGSLWTLMWELRMYGVVALTWLALRPSGSARLRWYGRVVIALAVVFAGLSIAPFLTQLPVFETDDYQSAARFGTTFFCGAGFYVLRDRIELNRLPLAISAAMLVAGVLLKFWPLYYFALTYLVLYAAYVPAGSVRRFNGVGDYSYGIYIYAFPIQQSVSAMAPAISPSGMTLIALPITLALAWCSWHLIEKRALGARQSVIARLKAAAAWPFRRGLGI